jgi:hypothetical protein
MSDSAETTSHAPEAANPVPRDDRLPAIPVLLGPDAPDVLKAAVAEGGGTVQSARPRFVMYRPGERITVRYWASVVWPDGRSKDTTMVATERTTGPPSGSIAVQCRDTTVGVWQWPNDPRLPGLGPAANPAYVRKLLDAYGAPPGRIHLATKSYWPGRRAVMEATIPSRGLRFDRERGRLGKAPTTLLLFIKVLRPGQAQSLYELHAKLGPGLPIADCPGGSDEHGLLVLQALPGTTLGQLLPRRASYAPEGAQLVDLLQRLGSVRLGGEPRVTTGHKVGNHVRLLKAVLPEESDALDRFEETYGEERPQPLTTVHGDFHESQVLVERDGRISGLLDVDDAGPGQLVDDLALMLGRVWALAYFANGDRAAIRRYAEKLQDAFGQAVDEAELRRRVSGALLGRATMPFRAQDPSWPEETRARLRLAEDWLARCERDGVLG